MSEQEDEQDEHYKKRYVYFKSKFDMMKKDLRKHLEIEKTKSNSNQYLAHKIKNSANQRNSPSLKHSRLNSNPKVNSIEREILFEQKWKENKEKNINSKTKDQLNGEPNRSQSTDNEDKASDGKEEKLSIHKNMKSLFAIGNQIKEQHSTKTEILENICKIQQEKNEIIKEMKKREEDYLDMVGQLELKNRELRDQLETIQADLSNEFNLNKKLRKVIEEQDSDNKDKNKKIENLENQIKKLESEKSSMTEIIKQFITKKNNTEVNKRK